MSDFFRNVLGGQKRSITTEKKAGGIKSDKWWIIGLASLIVVGISSYYEYKNDTDPWKSVLIGKGRALNVAPGQVPPINVIIDSTHKEQPIKSNAPDSLDWKKVSTVKKNFPNDLHLD